MWVRRYTFFKCGLLQIPLLLTLFQLSIFAQYEDSNINQTNLETLLDSAHSVVKKNTYAGIELYLQAAREAREIRNNEKLRFIYKKLGNAYYKVGNYELARVEYQNCIDLDTLSIDAADSYFNIGLLYRKADEEVKMIEAIQKSLDIYQDIEACFSKFNTYYKAGIILKNSAKYYTALDYLFRADEGFAMLRDTSKLASVSTLIGNVQRHLGNADISEKYYSKSLHLRIAQKDTIRIADSYNSLGNIHKELNNLDTALQYYRLAIQLKKKSKKTRELGRILGNLASVYHLKKELKIAHELYLDALTLKKKDNDELALANSYNELAHIAVERKHFGRARIFLDSVRLYQKDIDDKDFKLRSLETLAYYHEEIGNEKEAIEYLQEYRVLYESIFNEKQSYIIQELQERFESKKKENEILHLQLTNEEKQKTIQVQDASIKARNNLLILLLATVILLIVFYTLLRKIQKKNHYIEKIQAVHSSEDLIKENISRDLHDIIISNYEGVKLKLHSLFEKEGIYDKSRSIISQISDINHEVRMISHRLSPLGSKIQSATLREIVESQLVEFQMHQNIEVEIELPLPKELDSFHITAQSNFYGALSEILNNVGKHSEAKILSIRHNRIQDRIHFEFADNGTGFDKKIGPGIGLKNIEQRIELLEGKSSMESSMEGTLISFDIPIKTNLK